jgi:prepilin-type N-terminal cleavage/methylation domain-containing protein
MGGRAMEHRTKRSGEGGFSLIELLTVVAIIVIIAAAATPSLLHYVRFYRVRGAAQQLMSDLTRARQTAVSKNANNGVVVVFQNLANVDRQARYSVVLEDDQTPATRGMPIVSVQGAIDDLDAGVAGAEEQVLVDRITPSEIQFSYAGAADGCPGTGTGRQGLRFSRLGTAAPAADVDAGEDFLRDDGNGVMTICLEDQRRPGVTQQLSIITGGRVRIDR